MAIVVQCVCGKAYRMADEKAGRKLRCRSCDAIMRIPAVSAKPTKPRKPKPAAAPSRPAATPAKATHGVDRSLDDEIELVLDDESGSGEMLVLDLEEEDDDSDAELSLGVGLPVYDGPPDSTEFPALDLLGDTAKATTSIEAKEPPAPTPPAKPPAPPAEPPPTLALEVEPIAKLRDEPSAAVAAEEVFASDDRDDVMEVVLDDDFDHEPSTKPEEATTKSESRLGSRSPAAKEPDADPFAFLDEDDSDEQDPKRVSSRGGASKNRAKSRADVDEEVFDDIDLDPESDESIEVRDDLGEDDGVFDSDDEVPSRTSGRNESRSRTRPKAEANPNGTMKPKAAKGRRRSADLDDSADDRVARAADDGDPEAEGELEATWVNFAWAGGLTIAAIVAFLYLRWLEASGDTFTGEDGKGLERFLAWAYSWGGAWAVSGVLLALAGFFGWCGWTELAARRQQAARERRRERIRNRK